MDIYRFINSEAICNYIMELQDSHKYRNFTPVEKAWLIYQCQDATIKEKHMAWREIIEKEPDSEFVTLEDEYEEHYESLYDFLIKHMDAEDQLINRFYNANKIHECIYQFSVNTMDGKSGYPVVFRDFESVRDFLNDDMHGDCLSVSCETLDIGANWVIREKDNLCCRDCGTNNYYAILSPSFEVRKIQPSSHIDGLGNFEFKKMVVNFPTPFKKGDVLCIPDKNLGVVAGPFVNDILYDHELDNIDGDPEMYTSLESIFGHIPKRQDAYDRIDAQMDDMFNLMNCEYYDAVKYHIEDPKIFIRW